MLYQRMHGQWPRAEHGPYFSLGRFGFAINLVAVVYGTLVAFEIAWPRKVVYGTKWYFQFGAYEFIRARVHHRLPVLLPHPRATSRRS